MALNTIFVIAVIGIGIWIWKDKSFRPREVAAVSALWVLLMMTTWGSGIAEFLQTVVTSGVTATDSTISSGK